MKYDTVIGLEIHAELSTDTKVFCSCSAQFGGMPNTHICPVCTGQPGALPIINRAAVEYAIRAGLAFGCDINRYSRFDRKNYFYPDLPKAYQISQLDLPLCINGKLELSTGTVVRINRIHLEEDAGKLVHDDYHGESWADYNRCSVPLIEIVTEPDIKSAEEAAEFVSKIGLYLKYLGVCDAKMQEGSIRADVNVSLKPEGSEKLGDRAELKNMNSMRSIIRAIEYEIKRQTEILDNGGKVEQETRRFDDAMGTTSSLRSKENANDYRYFPEPDVLAITFTEEDIENARRNIPLLPHERVYKYVNEYKLTDEDARVITLEKYISDFYDETVAIYPEYKNVANLFLTEIMRRVKDTETEEIPFSAKDFAKVVEMADKNTVNRNDAKTIIRIMFEEGGEPMEIAKANGFIVEVDTGAISEFIDNLLKERADLVEDYRNGKQNVFGFFMGQATRGLTGKATPKDIKEYLEKVLKG
ncbi:MAG: Asp-tRNA(Asn)/Glu-tRNA(Gln) amidotransferase subunit GatB [Ruminococcaceae bacterium]|nr:Asp-tRNA(Asn)/Glu-tRNA(Gln) amidotransferase subunit GatB [Oscillospiraceae bacterium]